MKELFQRHGLVHQPNTVQADPFTAVRTTKNQNQFFVVSGKGGFLQRRHKRRIDTLQRFAETSLPSRALRMIRNGISSLDWGLQPKVDVNDNRRDAYEEAIQVVKDVLENPNNEDDDFYTFIGQIVEDICVFDAGVWEYDPFPQDIDGNESLGLHPVAGHTIQLNAKWDGTAEDIRWAQVVGDEIIRLTDSQIEYLMERKRTYTPWGVGRLETVVEIMEAWLGLSAYQRDTGSNAYPAFLIYGGEEIEPGTIDLLRDWWEHTVTGQGEPKWFGNVSEPKVLQLKPTGDEGLYLKYYEMLMRAMALGFDLKAQDFNLERDVNRSTAEVADKASAEEARKPIAELIASKINNKVIPRAAAELNNPIIRDLEFFWIGLHPRDQQIEAEIHESYSKSNTLTIDEIRSEIDYPPLPNDLGKMTSDAFKEFMVADMGQSFLRDGLAAGQSKKGVLEQLMANRQANVLSGKHVSKPFRLPFYVHTR